MTDAASIPAADMWLTLRPTAEIDAPGESSARPAGFMSITLRPGTYDEAGIYVYVSEDKWNPDVRVRFPVAPEHAKKAEQAMMALPLPGRIAPVSGGEEKTRGREFTQLAPPPADFDPWALAQAPSIDTLKGLDERRLKQLMAAVSVQAYRGVIERTGKFVLDALNVCISHGLTPPKWLTDMFQASLRPVARGHVGSLDEAFQHPHTDDDKRETAARHMALRPLVMGHLINELVSNPLLVTIEPELFRSVAKRCGIGTSQCYKIYQEARADGAQDLTYLRKKLLEELGYTVRGRPLRKPRRT